MSDQADLPVLPTDAPDTTGEQPQNRTVPLKEHVELRKERNKYKELYEAQQAKQQEVEQAEALKRGDHEKIIADLKPKAERLTALESVIAETLANEVATLPEAQREQAEAILALIPTPEGRLAALPKLRALVPSQPAKPTPPPLNGGEGQRSNGNALTPSPIDIEFAMAAGIPIEKYMMHKAKEK